MSVLHKRPQYKEVTERINEVRSKLQVIVGPRQVGKSTLIGQVLEECTLPNDSYSADDVIGVTASWLAEIWEAQRMKMLVRKEEKRLSVIDEVQKIQNWSETIKAEWDRDTREKRQLVVILLGSSRMLIEKGLTESLAGRFELIRLLCGLQNMHPTQHGNTIPKFQVHNNALRNVYADENFTEAIESPKAWGRYVESAIGAYLVTQAPIHDFKVYYWREKKEEVDFILVRRKKKS